MVKSYENLVVAYEVEKIVLRSFGFREKAFVFRSGASRKNKVRAC
jgi:hypothetical protein